MGGRSKNRWSKSAGRYSYEVTVANGVVSLDEEYHVRGGGGGVTTCTLAQYESGPLRGSIREKMGARVERAITRAVGAALGRTLAPLGAEPPPDPDIQRIMLRFALHNGGTSSLADEARRVDLNVVVGSERRYLIEEAVIVGNHGGLKTLLECGASPDPEPDRSVLWLAVARDDAEAVALLSEAGAQADAVVDGRAVRDLAVERGNTRVLAALNGGMRPRTTGPERSPAESQSGGSRPPSATGGGRRRRGPGTAAGMSVLFEGKGCTRQRLRNRRCRKCKRRGIYYVGSEVLHGNPASPAADTEVAHHYECPREDCGHAWTD